MEPVITCAAGGCDAGLRQRCVPEGGTTVVGKVMLVLAGAAGCALIVSQWPDIRRYVKIRQLSVGGGHPQNVPARGRTAYPQRPAGGDGRGDFDSARRGGPAR